MTIGKKGDSYPNHAEPRRGERERITANEAARCYRGKAMVRCAAGRTFRRKVESATPHLACSSGPMSSLFICIPFLRLQGENTCESSRGDA